MHHSITIQSEFDERKYSTETFSSTGLLWFSFLIIFSSSSCSTSTLTSSSALHGLTFVMGGTDANNNQTIICHKCSVNSSSRLQILYKQRTNNITCHLCSIHPKEMCFIHASLANHFLQLHTIRRYTTQMLREKQRGFQTYFQLV